MKKVKLLLLITLFSGSLYAVNYPDSFSYSEYISAPHDQLAMGPCHAFATVAAMEAAYKMYYGATVDLSEVALYNSAFKDLNLIIDAAKNGVVPNSHHPYPVGSPCSATSQQYLYLLTLSNFNQIQDQKNCGTRYKPTFTSFGTGNNATTIKMMLMKYGPFVLGGGNHTMLLYGWDGSQFLFKDSYPCAANIAKKLTLSQMASEGYTRGYAITSIVKQTWNGSTWNTVNQTIQPFTLAASKNGIITLNKPCFNNGAFTLDLSSLGNSSEAYPIDWQVNKSGISKSISGNTCTLTGYATDVTLTVIVRRVNGMQQKFNFYLGTVGIQAYVSVSKTSAYCMGSNYEITTKINHSTFPDFTYSYNYNIPPLNNYSYVIKNGAYAYWVFKAPETVNFTASVTFKKDGCSLTKSTSSYVYSLPCGSYYRTAGDQFRDDTLDEPQEVDIVLYPNPTSNKVNISGMPEGVSVVRIIDMQGNLVHDALLEASTELDVSGYTRGIYMVECYSKNRETLYKREKLVIN